MKCDFNDSKSCIKVLEYTSIGVPGVYSNAEPYKDCLLANDEEDGIIMNIERLANDIDFRKEVWDHDYSLVEKDLYWEDNENLKKYINSYLSLFKKRLKD